MVCKARCPSWPPKMNSSPALPLSFFFNVNDCLYLFIYLWLCWVFVSVRGLSLVAASGDHSSSRCAGLSPSRPLLLRSTGSRRAGSAIVAHGPRCSVACGIVPDQGSNPCPLHWQADSQPLRHQGSPLLEFLKIVLIMENFLNQFGPPLLFLFQKKIFGCYWTLNGHNGECSLVLPTLEMIFLPFLENFSISETWIDHSHFSALYFKISFPLAAKNVSTSLF